MMCPLSRSQKRDLEQSNAPMAFRVEEFFLVPNQGMSHADVVDLDNINGTWATKPSLLICFLKTGDAAEYADVKRRCLRRVRPSPRVALHSVWPRAHSLMARLGLVLGCRASSARQSTWPSRGGRRRRTPSSPTSRSRSSTRCVQLLFVPPIDGLRRPIDVPPIDRSPTLCHKLIGTLSLSSKGAGRLVWWPNVR
eukprot:SAG11_NODE_161_length_14021_cov_36.845065_3_plen_195_part_00